MFYTRCTMYDVRYIFSWVLDPYALTLTLTLTPAWPSDLLELKPIWNRWIRKVCKMSCPHQVYKKGNHPPLHILSMRPVHDTVNFSLVNLLFCILNYIWIENKSRKGWGFREKQISLHQEIDVLKMLGIVKQEHFLNTCCNQDSRCVVRISRL